MRVRLEGLLLTNDVELSNISLAEEGTQLEKLAELSASQNKMAKIHITAHRCQWQALHISFQIN